MFETLNFTSAWLLNIFLVQHLLYFVGVGRHVGTLQGRHVGTLQEVKPNISGILRNHIIESLTLRMTPKSGHLLGIT